ncbi:unnamed protein product [Sympodiomycopsis kandeliae]
MTSASNVKRPARTAQSSAVSALAPPPTSLMSPLSAWNLFSEYFIDSQGQVSVDLREQPRSEQSRSHPSPQSGSSRARSTSSAARREIIAALSVRPSSAYSSPSSPPPSSSSSSSSSSSGEKSSLSASTSVPKRNPFSRYARFEKRRRAMQRSEGHRDGQARRLFGGSSSILPRSTSHLSDASADVREASSDSLTPKHQRAKSVEEAITRLGWFWDSDAHALWEPQRQGLRRNKSDPTQDQRSDGQPADQSSTLKARFGDSTSFIEGYGSGQLDINDIAPGCPCPDGIMQAPLPPYEEARKRVICRLGVFSLPDQVLERLHAIASHVRDALHMSIFMLDVLFGEEGWEIEQDGIVHHNNFRRETLCAHTILNARRGMTVLDLKSDWRFSGNPILTPVSFYSGYPVASASGLPLGALCVMDANARPEFTDEEKGLIRLAAEQVSYIIEENFADSFLLKMNRLATTHEVLKDQLSTVPRRSLPQLDPVSFALAKPLKGIDGSLSLDGKSADLFSLDRCCQRIAAAMNLDAAYIVALSPMRGQKNTPVTQANAIAQTIAQSGAICPQHHHTGSGRYYMEAFDSSNGEDCAIFQNALDGVTSAPLPQACGHASDQHFTCALILPLTVWSKSTRQDTSSGHRSAGLSHPIKVHFALVAASLQPRHVLGIEDLRFLQSLRPHLLNVMQKCLKSSSQASQRGQPSSRQSPHIPADGLPVSSQTHMDRIKFGLPASFITHGKNRAHGEPRTPHVPGAAHDVSPNYTMSSAWNLNSVKGEDNSRASQSQANPVFSGMKIQADRGRHGDAQAGSSLHEAQDVSASSAKIPFPPSSSSLGNKLIPVNIKRHTSGSSPLSRLSSPLSLMNAADSVLHTLHLQTRRSSNSKSSSSTTQTRGSGDSSTGLGRSWEAGHVASSSIGTSVSSEESQPQISQELLTNSHQGKSSRKDKDHRGSLASSTSSSSVKPVSNSAPRGTFAEQNSQLANKGTMESKSTRRLGKKEEKSAEINGRPHHSSFLSKLRRPKSAKSPKYDDDGDGDNDDPPAHSARPELRSISSFSVGKFHDSRTPQSSHTDDVDAARKLVDGSESVASMAASKKESECTRCRGLIPVKEAPRADEGLKSNAKRSTTSSPRRPRTAGEHQRGKGVDAGRPTNSGMLSGRQNPPCTCIIPSPRVEENVGHADAASHVASTPEGVTAGLHDSNANQIQQRCDRWIADLKTSQSQGNLRPDRASLDFPSFTQPFDEDALEMLSVDGDDLDGPSANRDHATVIRQADAVILPSGSGDIARLHNTATQSLTSLPVHTRSGNVVSTPTTVPMVSRPAFTKQSESSSPQQESKPFTPAMSTDDVAAGPGLSPMPPISKTARIRH